LPRCGRCRRWLTCAPGKRWLIDRRRRRPRTAPSWRAQGCNSFLRNVQFAEVDFGMTVCDPRHVMIRGYMSASATGGRGVESPRSVPPVGSHPLLTWIRSHLSPRTEQTRKPPVAIGNAVSPRACQSRPIDVHVSRRRRTHRPRRRQAMRAASGQPHQYCSQFVLAVTVPAECSAVQHSDAQMAGGCQPCAPGATASPAPPARPRRRRMCRTKLRGKGHGTPGADRFPKIFKLTDEFPASGDRTSIFSIFRSNKS
jgi:hypothetical protein